MFEIYGVTPAEEDDQDEDYDKNLNKDSKTKADSRKSAKISKKRQHRTAETPNQ